MKIVFPDDYQNAIIHLACYKLLQEHNGTIYNDTSSSIDNLVERLKDADAIVLIRERTEITEQLLSRLPNLKLISQTDKISNHLDIAACKSPVNICSYFFVIITHCIF